MAKTRDTEVHIMSLGKFDRHGSFSVDIKDAAMTPEFMRMAMSVRAGLGKAKKVGNAKFQALSEEAAA